MPIGHGWPLSMIVRMPGQLVWAITQSRPSPVTSSVSG